MDIYDETLLGFWNALNERSVQYIMVGGVATNILDIMTSLKGMEEHTFDECLEYASIAEIDGIKVPFLHINHLIEAKKAANRPKDQVDIQALEKIKLIRDSDLQR
jgi:hypothetical protein